MKAFGPVSGTIVVELTGAQVTTSMDILTKSGIEIKDIVPIDSLCVRFSVSRQDYPQVERLLRKHGDNVKILRRAGLYWSARSLLKRPVLVLGLLVLLLSALYLPNHIFFVRVQGNQRLTSGEILSAAEMCGVYFGVSAREIRSEWMKNRLLEYLPQLQWAAVNTQGCVATIQVRERDQVQMLPSTSGYASIVAARDGVIMEGVAYRGTLLCAPGQAVKAGDVLISGITDCGLLMKYTQADGDILAQTKRQLQAICPNPYAQNLSDCVIKKEYALRIGKNIIKFSKDSGISDMSCGKMYEEKYVELPGGFQLPIAWICKTTYTMTPVLQSTYSTFEQEQLIENYVHSQMIGGKILSKNVTHTVINGATEWQAQFDCLEMIGKKSDKEILQEYEQTD